MHSLAWASLVSGLGVQWALMGKLGEWFGCAMGTDGQAW